MQHKRPWPPAWRAAIRPLTIIGSVWAASSVHSLHIRAALLNTQTHLNLRVKMLFSWCLHYRVLRAVLFVCSLCNVAARRSLLQFPARLLLQPTDCCRYAVNFNKENKRMNQFFLSQTVVPGQDVTVCLVIHAVTMSHWSQDDQETSIVWWKFFFSAREHRRPRLKTDSTAAVMSRCPPALYEPLIRIWSVPQQLLCPLFVKDLAVIVWKKLWNRWY